MSLLPTTAPWKSTSWQDSQTWLGEATVKSCRPGTSLTIMVRACQCVVEYMSGTYIEWVARHQEGVLSVEGLETASACGRRRSVCIVKQPEDAPRRGRTPARAHLAVLFQTLSYASERTRTFQISRHTYSRHTCCAVVYRSEAGVGAFHVLGIAVGGCHECTREGV